MDSQGLGPSSSQRYIFSSCSCGKISHDVPPTRSSISLSRDGSSRAFEEVPSDIIAQLGDSGAPILDDSRHYESRDDEAVRAGSKRWSFGRISSRGSWRKDSIRLSKDIEDEIFNDVRSQVVADDGESGHRVVGDDGYNRSTSALQISENTGNPVLNDPSNDLKSFSKNGSSVSPLPLAIALYPLPPDAIFSSKDKSSRRSEILQCSSSKEPEYKLPRLLNYLIYLISLAVFGILGVITRYLLQKLFGPSVLGLTSDRSLLYPDFPSNIAGSFLMGWLGVVFKGDLCYISDHLGIGLTTGYLGSLTTFSGWNQAMLNLSSRGNWVHSVAGILLGMFDVSMSILIGVVSAGWFRGWLTKGLDQSSESTTTIYVCGNWRVNNPKRHTFFITTMLLILALLWGVSGEIFWRKWDESSNGAVLWLGCLVGPPGVWLRWYLARLNGKGLGKKRLLGWLPIGTLAANVLGASVMAALATIKNAVNTRKSSIIVGGIQLGFLGCLSTVSTFAAEVYAIWKNGHPGRALAYVAATFIISFALGTLIYSVPVWTKHYH